MSQQNETVVGTGIGPEPTPELVTIRKDEYEYFVQQLKDHKRFTRAVMNLLPQDMTSINPLNPIELMNMVKKVMKGEGAIKEYNESLTHLKERYYSDGKSQTGKRLNA